MDRLTIRRPDDWHVHFRDGPMLNVVVPWTARQFGRAIVMPNLTPPITTISAATAYRERILAAVEGNSGFIPLMTYYLTDTADIHEITKGHAEGAFFAVKFYPAGATTNSDAGVTEVKNVMHVFERMEKIGMPLLVHGEVTSPDVDVFDREAIYIEQVLSPIVREFPSLKIVFEHVTTKEAVDFVHARSSEAPGCMAATITAHHLVINRSDMFKGGIRPHLYCLPIAKRESHRLALRAAATSGSTSFFLGSDTAPHTRNAKESACGCAGIFSAPIALEKYMQVFDEENALVNFEAFASLNGPKFYGLSCNQETITLERGDADPPESVKTYEDEMIRVFEGGEPTTWRLT
ncbi:MAG: dihydroorotase [Rhodospirillaceae bacterium TMED8]|nr:dihydroorotase [Magnetovibrio sp.]OUT52348.1 MAG: dihydroorotase [Rhodospirillaceae bacterium TMED8]|tara:strand:- start:693 stop:1739 length:1047 start_codon:yes stop_codon:yes gene_type:complete